MLWFCLKNLGEDHIGHFYFIDVITGSIKNLAESEKQSDPSQNSFSNKSLHLWGYRFVP